MSAPSVETLSPHGDGRPAFDRVREGIGIYGGASEPIDPGSSLLLARRDGQEVARASIDVVAGLHDAGGPSGLVGHYEALDAEAGAAVLKAAQGALAARGVARVLGPMNGSTWGRYRFALREAADDPPPFLTEPWNPARYPSDFLAAGFSVAAHYESRIDESLASEPDDAAVLAARVRAARLRVRTLDLARFDEELDRLFTLSLEAFAGNLYYTPIDATHFRAQYVKIRPLVDPELVWIAEDAAEQPMAFQFAFRDPMAAATGAPRVIVKTVATAPSARGLGLGGHLLDLIRRRALAIGCGSVIHALMHVKNLSMRMSARHRSRVFRSYALYQWTP